jgi:hypothetical protein
MNTEYWIVIIVYLWHLIGWVALYRLKEVDTMQGLIANMIVTGPIISVVFCVVFVLDLIGLIEIKGE